MGAGETSRLHLLQPLLPGPQAWERGGNRSEKYQKASSFSIPPGPAPSLDLGVPGSARGRPSPPWGLCPSSSHPRARQSPGVGGRRPRAAGSLRWPWPERQLGRVWLTGGPVTRVRRRGRCRDLVESPGGGGRGQDPRAAIPSVSPEPDPPPERVPIRGPATRDTGAPALAREPAQPRPALRYLGAPERAGPAPAAAPHPPRARSRACGRAGPAAGGRPRPRRAGRPGGRRRRSPQPAAPPPRARLRSSAAAAGPHNGSGRAVTHPAPPPARPPRAGPRRTPPARQPLRRARHAWRGTGARPYRPAIPRSLPTLLRASLPLRSPGGDPPPQQTQVAPTLGTRLTVPGKHPSVPV